MFNSTIKKNQMSKSWLPPQPTYPNPPHPQPSTQTHKHTHQRSYLKKKKKIFFQMHWMFLFALPIQYLPFHKKEDKKREASLKTKKKWIIKWILHLSVVAVVNALLNNAVKLLVQHWLLLSLRSAWEKGFVPYPQIQIASAFLMP